MVMGVCNGFQILVEAGLLPGALMRNASLKFVCREVKLEVSNANTAFTRGYKPGQIIRCPVAHHDGNYFADAETLKRLEGEGQVVFRYAEGTNPNGSVNDIAGIVNARGNVLGMMPHPENLIESAHGGDDGRALLPVRWASRPDLTKMNELKGRPGRGALLLLVMLFTARFHGSFAYRIFSEKRIRGITRCSFIPGLSPLLIFRARRSLSERPAVQADEPALSVSRRFR